MNRIKGTLLIAGVAAAFAVAVACSNGEASSTPVTEPAPSAPAASIQPQTPIEPATVAPPASSQPSAQNQPVSLPPVISPPVAEPLSSPHTVISSGPAPAPVRIRSETFTSAVPSASAAPFFQVSNSQMGIWVNGEGTVSLEPDLVLLNIGVETNAPTVSDARGQAASAMDAVVAALNARDIQANDIQTQFFNISPMYEYREVVELGGRSNRRILVGYQVSNSTRVKIRDLDAVGDIIDAVAAAGGDSIRINGINFTIEDPKPFMNDLREQAVLDAMAKAQQFASLTGVIVGQLVFISEAGSGGAIVQDFARAEFAMAAPAFAPQTSISGGELELRMNVQAVFSIQ